MSATTAATPEHRSWLNIAEIELSALTRQCLDRRIDDLAVLNTELAAWQQHTNSNQRQVDWHFTTDDARAAPPLPNHTAKLSRDDLLVGLR
ncbi:hypothetical protein [Streptomyces sp. NA02950]|uniref:hypothetical protein n=1 Tax=Streptomyces sp. NA02950 TaxID=2742137 RepID=UPI001C379312|nr:hypothetical protein [Streptomyces sp. NA02950]